MVSIFNNMYLCLKYLGGKGFPVDSSISIMFETEILNKAFSNTQALGFGSIKLEKAPTHSTL